MDDEQIDDVFQVMAHPVMRQILDELRQGERRVRDLVAATDEPQPMVSKYLRKLRELQLVAYRSEGPVHWYRLLPEPLRTVDHWLAPFRELDRLPGDQRGPGTGTRDDR